MVENEIILTSFVKERFQDLSQSEVGLLERLLDEPDPAIFKWFNGTKPPDHAYEDSSLLNRIVAHTRSMNNKN